MKRGTPDHPKTLALMQQLQVGRVMAVGVLEMLWHFTAGYAKRGDIGRYTDEQIAKGIGWDGPCAQEFVDALISAKWLDRHRKHRLVVHDWPEHADDAVHRALARAKTRFADGTIPKLTRLSTKERTEIEEFFRAHKRRTRGAPPEPRQSPAPPEPRQGQEKTDTPPQSPPDGGERPCSAAEIGHAVSRLVAFASEHLGYRYERADRRRLGDRLRGGETEEQIRAEYERILRQIEGADARDGPEDVEPSGVEGEPSEEEF